MTRIIAILMLFEGSAGFSLIARSAFLIKGGKYFYHELSTSLALRQKTVRIKSKWENVSHVTQLLILNQVHGIVAAITAWPVLFWVLFVYCATKLIIAGLLLLPTRKLPRHQRNGEAENV